VAAILLVLAAAPAAQAFDTGPHHDMTVDALSAEGFARPAADIVAVNNYFVDLYSNEKENPFSGHHSWYHPLTIVGGGTFHNEHWDAALVEATDRLHFDPHDQNQTSTTAEIEAEWERLQRGTTRSLKDAKDLWALSRGPSGYPQQAADAALTVLSALGVSLHALQDFYTHTNWLEPGAGAGGQGPGWAAQGQGTTPTWYDLPKGLRDGADIYAGRSPGHRPHGSWKEDRNENLNRGMNKDWSGRPLFTEAYRAAYFATRQWVRAVRRWLANEELWGRAMALAERPAELQRDVLGGAFLMSLYSGHWQGEGEPCNPKGGWPAPIGKGELSCGERSGWGGNLLDLRSATKSYFQRGKTRFRGFFEGAARAVGYHSPVGETFPVESSRDIQAATRFVRLQVLSIRGVELGDPGPDDADMYTRASIAGQDFDSAVIHSHDRFSFPRPYHAFTWLRSVPAGGSYGEPVSTMTVELRTSNDRSAGTDDDVSLRIGSGRTWTLDKRLYDDFERGDRDTYSVPIDAATRRGLSVGDIQQVEIAKSKDGVGGGWKLAGVKLTVNGRVLYRNDRVNRWLENSKRVWRAPDFAPSAPAGPALPVWLDLREDDTVYGGDDQGDVNPYDARDALARGYVPGTVAEQTISGGEKYRGRLGKDGDDGVLRYRIDTLDMVPPPPLPKPPDPPPEDPPKPGDPPPPPKPDLIVTALNQYSFTVKNQGAGAAGPFTVTLVGAGTHNFDGLAAGASASRTYNSSCEAGSSEARADSLDQVDESDETNNVTRGGPYFC
jgi:hypothetical protein